MLEEKGEPQPGWRAVQKELVMIAVTRVEFAEELQTLRERLLEMGADADAMLDKAMRALTTRNVALAEQVIEQDDVLDRLDLDIEAECMRLIALQQPMARDLRLIGTCLKATTDLERIGDHAVDIAKVARKLAQGIFYKPLVDLPVMAAKVRTMLKQALTSFVDHNLELVKTVVKEDDEVDTLFHNVRDELHSNMKRDPALVVQGTYLLFVAHYLERIADHIVNIAERVHYVETGNLAQLAESHMAKS
ncbi:MAG TPA: phosphate signaling complex protein PhoU [Chthonomonadales bacterium]|nr:phosphate signaling complex protein PhoU [Chthonomonadales bacterium]